VSGSNWTTMRRIALGRMRRYKSYKRHQIEQLKLRTRMAMRRSIRRSYTLLMTPSFKKARS
jgi:hypothetical protein